MLEKTYAIAFTVEWKLLNGTIDIEYMYKKKN